MKIIIACAGKSTRFGTGTPKQIEPIQKKPNILRTIELLNLQQIDNHDIYISVSPENQSFFKPISPNLIIGSGDREIDRYRNLFKEIAKGTIILYGDVVYHEKDLQEILKINSQANVFFGRLDKNELTKKNYGEIFGVYIGDPAKFIRDTNETAKLYEQKIITREIGWDVYRISEGKNPRVRKTFPSDHFIELSNYTDDYDTQEEYAIIKQLYKDLV